MSLRNFSLICILILAAAATRLMPLPPNMAPIAAMGLFGAAHFRRFWAFVVPFAGLFLSDLYLNNVVYAQYYEGFVWITSWWIYAAFAAVIGLGFVMFGKGVTLERTIQSSLLASIVFFLISNLSAFFESNMYPQTPAGLLACYVAGLPFLLRTMVGDLAFVGILFGSYYWVTRKVGAFKMV
jgi:hypothetical protein